MAHHKSAKKRIRKSAKENLANRSNMSNLKTVIKKVESAKGKEEAEQLLRDAISVLDKSVSKGIIHKNKAANKKSSLTKFVKTLA